jgi:hypothetical protein
VTLAVTVTIWPLAAGLGEAETAVVVEKRWILWMRVTLPPL